MLVFQGFCGFCIALADSVPGVSGGTVAFIMGFYMQLIDALRNLFTTDKQKRKAAFIYLCRLGCGWLLGISGAVLALSALFERNIYFMSSLFLGLTVSAIPFILKSERKTIRGRHFYITFTAIGFTAVAGFSMICTAVPGISAIDFSSPDMLQAGYLLFSGAIAITAMMLPGISGSTLLLIMGIYIPLINALHRIIRLDFSMLPGIILIAVGIFLGTAFTARGIRSAFKRFRAQCIFLITGMVAGSAIPIIMGPLSLGKPALSLSDFSITGFSLGIIILLGLEMLSKSTAKKSRNIQN